MKEAGFRMWMIEKKNNNTIRTYIARCFRVEEALKVNLDDEFRFDGGKRVIQLLSYSRNDERNKILPDCGLVFAKEANIYLGMHSLRASVKKYFEFLSAVEQQEKE